LSARPAIEPVGQWLGAHALSVFGFGLCGVLIGTGVAWHLAGRRLRAPASGEQLSPIQFALLLAAGFAVIVGAGSGFAEIAEGIAHGGDVARFDQAFAMALAANAGTYSRDAFASLTRLGDPSTIVALAAIVGGALAYIGRRWLAFAWIASLAGSALLNEALKAVFARVRPLHDPAFVAAHGWSFPSGHSSGAVVAYGLLAYLAVRLLSRRWHLPAVISAAVLAFTIGSSRVFVGVHFVSDVVAGFLSGSAWLAVCIVSIEWARRHDDSGRRVSR